jgi:hypothetical protein
MHERTSRAVGAGPSDETAASATRREGDEGFADEESSSADVSSPGETT